MLQSIESRLSGRRVRVDVFEREPARELVASKDILRRDQLGRTVVACPKGMVPSAWLKLSGVERESLVAPPPPPATGTIRRSGGFGFVVEGVGPIGPTGFVR